jgi:hypothetical protein
MIRWVSPDWPPVVAYDVNTVHSSSTDVSVQLNANVDTHPLALKNPSIANAS